MQLLYYVTRIKFNTISHKRDKFVEFTRRGKKDKEEEEEKMERWCRIGPVPSIRLSQ